MKDKAKRFSLIEGKNYTFDNKQKFNLMTFNQTNFGEVLHEKNVLEEQDSELNSEIDHMS